MYHNAIGDHVQSLVLEGLSDTQIVQLLGWINSYHTEEFMKDPVLNIDFNRLNLLQPINLLPESQLDALRILLKRFLDSDRGPQIPCPDMQR
ncbi:unnamed protein product [Echinostoma caproni]|uniref:Cytoplasmic protein n=1 Tax=Echinostoma caproni TaxID=27848 RepID=A0A183A219_9TREM|nr:unnamed protein product [Echinostoma caproni]